MRNVCVLCDDYWVQHKLRVKQKLRALPFALVVGVLVASNQNQKNLMVSI